MKLARGFASALFCAALATPSFGAETAVPKVGFLGASTEEKAAHLLNAFKQGLRERGYEDGKNIIIETRYADGKMERLAPLAAELAASKVNVILAPPNIAAQAAKDAAPKVPVVFALVGDPVGAGFAQSLARPGGNMTGLSTINVELGPKRLELLKEAFPKTSKVAVLFNPADSSNDLQLKATEKAAASLGVKLIPAPVKRTEDFTAAFEQIHKDGADALIVMETPVIFTNRDTVVALVAKQHLPTIYSLKELVDAGGLMAYSINFIEQLRSSATYVDKILKGAKPGDLPIEQPTRIELILNLKTAKAQGLKIPESLLVRADKIIR